ncbi:VOC family protein [Macrococcus hajekii]|uniref:VOC family protein n=1 Tax=Macrococcus hajekii TaxID=198482 RepID=A0A4R6BIH2_9STAP|nr:VOC family protein [Macrococcus hajekii]TDM01377.1 VOC family protein [Macrococcus hajekii]GGB11090.1 glyoxalase [Macrococcus hajekii]
MDSKFFTKDTHIGAVHLNVNFLENSIRFYNEILGMDVLEQNETYTSLGVANRPLIYLYETQIRRESGQAGLYHLAILVPSRTELGNIFNHLIQIQYPLAGASDHDVSEAIYLQDPEGNGIEIYRDLPTAEWTYADNGFITMGTVEMDYQGVLDAKDGKPFTTLHPDTVMGHIHLSVQDIPSSIEFYKDIFGMDLMLLYGPQAAFMSAAGYHHHLGMNVWQHAHSKPSLDAPGLRKFEINIPNQEDFEYFKEQVAAKGISTEKDGDSEILRDPNGIGIRVMYQKQD